MYTLPLNNPATAAHKVAESLVNKGAAVITPPKPSLDKGYRASLFSFCFIDTITAAIKAGRNYILFPFVLNKQRGLYFYVLRITNVCELRKQKN